MDEVDLPCKQLMMWHCHVEWWCGIIGDVECQVGWWGGMRRWESDVACKVACDVACDMENVRWCGMMMWQNGWALMTWHMRWQMMWHARWRVTWLFDDVACKVADDVSFWWRGMHDGGLTWQMTWHLRVALMTCQAVHIIIKLSTMWGGIDT